MTDPAFQARIDGLAKQLADLRTGIQSGVKTTSCFGEHGYGFAFGIGSGVHNRHDWTNRSHYLLDMVFCVSACL